MTKSDIKHTVSIILAAVALCCTFFGGIALAEEEEEDALALYSGWQEESTSASRSPKPLSQSPENITIVTARDIEIINAHTLSDVLATIPGVQTHVLGGPGSTTYTYIQGASFPHTLVMLDGAPLNKISNFSDVGSVPARIIERIEIVKGSASSAWGPALDGVINVITKSPDKRPVSGALTSSIGDRTTNDSSVELSGTVKRLGYYLSAGYLGSNGLLPGRPLYSNNTYAKLTYDLPDNGQIWATFNQNRSRQGENYTWMTGLEFQEVADQYSSDYTLGMKRQLTERVGMELVSFYTHRKRYDYNDWLLPPSPWDYVRHREKVGGANARLTWKSEHHLLVGGADFIHEDYQTYDIINQTSLIKRSQKRIGVYLNDTISLGDLTLVPGIRYDNTRNGDQFSPSFGATYKLTDTLLLRAYTGKGFGYTHSANGWKPQKIWTTQVGLESTTIPYLWQKLTLFRNQTWDIVDSRNWDTSLPEQRMALGVEYEVRTTPVFNTSLSAGYNFTDLTRTSNGSQVKSFARHTLQLGLKYDDKTFRAMLNGRHIFWNHCRETDPPSYVNFNGSYYGIIWDLHLGYTVYKREHNSLELFFSGRNLFNGAQYGDELQPNVGRWFEGGARWRF